MRYKLTGSDLSLDVAFTDSTGTQYPSNWLRSSTAADRAAVPTGGITWENDNHPAYDQEFYWSATKPKDIAVLKPQWVQKQKNTANSLLAKTDWMVTRQAEGGTSIPDSYKTYRANVRTVCGTREGELNAAADTAALETVYKSGLTAWPTKPS